MFHDITLLSKYSIRPSNPTRYICSQEDRKRATSFTTHTQEVSHMMVTEPSTAQIKAHS